MKKNGTFFYMRLDFTTTPRTLITLIWRKLFILMSYAWNFRQQIRSAWSSLVCYTVSSRNAPPDWGEALRDDTNNGCVAD